MALATSGLKEIEESTRDKVGNTELPEYDEKDSDWKDIHEKVKSRDSTMLKDYDNEVDTLLVFAGLFSAILTAFIVDVYQDLKVDNSEATVALLQRMLDRMDGLPTSDIRSPQLAAHPSAVVIVVVSLWFTGLVLSLLAALFCIFIKQWLHAYSKWIDVAQSQSLRHGLVLRGFYQSSLNTWHLPDIFAGLGVLLQLALVLFVLGLVAYLWTLNIVVSPIMTFLAFVMIVSSFVTILLPLFFVDCPYKFPMAYLLLKFGTGFAGRDWTDRDLPIAQERFKLTRGTPIDKAISQMALLLDISPATLVCVLRDPQREVTPAASPAAVIAEQNAQLVNTRIRQLSPDSTLLLISIVTSESLRKSHSEALAAASNGTRPQLGTDGSVQFDLVTGLYRLWNLVFPAVQQPPVTVVLALRHLTSTLDSGPAAKDVDGEEQHLRLLVDVLLPQCVRLNQKGLLQVAELADAAMAVNAWASRTALQRNGTFATFAALRALKGAADAIPRDSPETGLSPITPYISLLTALQHRVASAQRLGSTADPYQPDERQARRQRAVETSLQLCQELSSLHESFVCLSRRGFARPEGRNDRPRTAYFSSDGSEVRVGSDEAMSWRISLETGTSETVLPSYRTTSARDLHFHHAIFSRSGSHVFWGSHEGPLLLMPTQAEPLLSDLESGEMSRPLAISPDETYVVVDNDTAAALLCDTTTGEVVMPFDGHLKRLVTAAFSPVEPARLATTSFDNTAMVWDISSGYCILSLLDLGYEVNAIAWSHDATTLAVSVSNDIRIFDAASGDHQATLKGHTKLVTYVTFCPNSTLVASASNDHTVRLWNIGKKSSDPACVAVLTGPKAAVHHVDFSRDSRRLSCAADDSVWIWDLNEMALRSTSSEDDVLPHSSRRDGRPRFRTVVEQVMKARLVANVGSPTSTSFSINH